MTYMLARPVLRRALGENEPTSYERDLLNGLQSRAEARNPREAFARYTKEPVASQAMGVDTIFAALFLSERNPGSPQARTALDRLWSLQIADGPDAGAWNWFELNLNPWETAESPFFGATLAALAVAAAPADYRARPEIHKRIDALADYLRREQTHQPLHNRLMLAWCSSRLPGVLSKPEARGILDQALAAQRDDGSWTAAALGPWNAHPGLARSGASDTYATAFTAFLLEQAGVAASDRHLRAALDWLSRHQDPATGAWKAGSMNKEYEPGSMPALFLQDAATAYAALALLGGR